MSDSGSDSGSDVFVYTTSNSRKHLVTPLRTLELRRTAIEHHGWLASSASTTIESDRIWSVYDTSSEDLKKPKYYIDLAASYHLPIWPVNMHQAVSIFAGETAVNDVLARKATPLEVITQVHSLFGHHMCTVGGVRRRDKPEGSSGSDVPTSWLSSGLGHGSWSDFEVEKALKLRGDEEHSWSDDRGAKWQAIGNNSKRIEWEGRGAVTNGALQLNGENNMLATYKPRSARWVGDGDSKEMQREDGIGIGFGIGALGICDERIDEDMARHILMSAVAIEEQIMWSKGFDSRKYHAGWM